MADINIHRCTLRIVRHGGWSWGPEPGKLLQSAIKALPDLLSNELSKLWEDDVELEFTAPISFRIPLRIAELAAVTDAGRHLVSTQTSTLQALGERVGQAARKALVGERPVTGAAPEPEAQSTIDQAIYLEREDSNESAVFGVLRSWRRAGVLSRRLAAFSQTDLEAWLNRLIQNARGPDSRDRARPVNRESIRRDLTDQFMDENVSSVTSEMSERSVGGARPSAASEMVESLVDESARRLQNMPGDRAAILRRRLIVLIEVMTEASLGQCTPALLSALDRVLPLDGSRRPGSIDSENSSEHSREHKTASGAAVGRLAGSSTLSPAVSMSDFESKATSNDESEARSAKLDFAIATGDRKPVLASRHAPTARETRLIDQVRAAKETEFSAAEFSGRPAKSEFSPSIAQTLQTEHPRRSPQPVTLPSPRPSRHGKSRQIASALPFLLLGPLSRIGYLKTLAATMEAADSLPALPCFAAALAYKVLAPPARGWRRKAESIAAATAFAGLDQPAAEPALVELAQQLSHRLSPLDVALSGPLISGHYPQKPLLLLRTGATEETGFLLVKVEGLYPIQYAASVSGLRQVLIELDSIILIPESSAEPGLLRWLDQEGFRFVTDAMPTRGERWRTLPRSPQQRWWTNEAIMSDSALVKVARTLRDAAEEVATLWRVLADQRPAIPLADDKTLDHHLTLAASVAMGTIAWELWRDREPTAPHLVLQRFGDLEARVTRKRDVVHVSLPLGKRFQDLRDHGLLDDVADVPWLNGRMLKF
ncbi:MAG TPA: hypothetical protein VK582_00755 [Pyrinomonadaceae bacterium]|nr:hypothetical protein [Pyrinomonadaceae bacterium]